MTGTELDEILADDGSQESAATEQVEQVEAPAQSRDENGRFAAKAEEQPEQEAEQEQPAQEDEEEGRVPQKALHASRQQAKEAKQRADALETTVSQLQAQLQMLSRQVAQPKQQPQPQEAEKEVTFWDNPDGYLGKALNPLQQQMAQQQERFSRMLAVRDHGAELVSEAEQAFNAALAALPHQEQQATMAKLRMAPDMYGEVIQWHSRQKTLQTVGSDPNAWFEAEVQKRLTSDPAFQAKVLESVKASAAQRTEQTSQPAIKLPPSLSRLPAGTNTAADGDMSDGALFSHALR